MRARLGQAPCPDPDRLMTTQQTSSRWQAVLESLVNASSSGLGEERFGTARHEFSLVLLDVHMRDSSGFETAALIWRASGTERARSSSSRRPSARRRASSAGYTQERWTTSSSRSTRGSARQSRIPAFVRAAKRILRQERRNAPASATILPAAGARSARGCRCAAPTACKPFMHSPRRLRYNEARNTSSR